MSSFKVVFVNVNSLISLSKRHYLKLLVEERRPDVLLLAEHKLNPSHNFSLEGYRVFLQYRDGAQRGGGTAVAIRDGIRCDRIPLSSGHIESCAVRV